MEAGSRRWATGRIGLAVAAGLVALAILATPAGAATPTERWVALVRQDDGSLVTRIHEVRAGTVPFVASDGDVVAFEPEVEVHLLGGPDQSRGVQWALDRTTFEAAWPAADGDGIVVAVVDTAVRTTHEDLAGHTVRGHDMLGAGDGSGSDHFHGSHVSGIIAAAVGNGVGIHGAAPGARIEPIRVLNASGSGTSTDVAEGIIAAVDDGARVVNLSLGTLVNSTVIAGAVDYAVEHGTVVVAAAGNSALMGNPVVYPAALPDVIAVGAIQRDGARAGYSSHGPWLDLVAPGTSVLSVGSADDHSYVSASGTSMASPHVAAAAALVLSARPDLTPAEVRNLLVGTARDLGPVGRDDEFGAGLVDPAAAVAQALRGDQIGKEPLSDPSPAEGYGIVTDTGRVLSFGTSSPADDTVPTLRAPIVEATPADGGSGHWLVSAVGEVVPFGGARHFGDARTFTLSAPIVGMAPTPDDGGYWLVAADGGIFAYGDARFYGSTGGLALNAPVVGMASTASGHGYWLVAADGGIFAYGDARFYGSAGSLPLVAPIVGMAPTRSGNGYWLVAADGGVFAYGDAGFMGSAAGAVGPVATTDVLVDPSGLGYRLLDASGQVRSFGAATDRGSGQLLPPETAVALLPL